MEFRVANPEWFWGLALVAPAVLLALRLFSSMSVVRRWSAVVLRLVLFALLTLLLAGASSVQRTDRFAVIFVVDVSPSMDRPTGMLEDVGEIPADLSGRRVLDVVKRAVDAAAARRGPDDLVGIVAFGEQSAAIVTPTRSRELDWTTALPLGEGTNIEGALRLARAMLPPDAAGRLVLISDGVETSGDALLAARQTAGARVEEGASRGTRGVVQVWTLPVEYEVKDEVYVESVDAPPRSAAQSTVSVRVSIVSTGPATGTLRLQDNDRAIDLSPGEAGDGRRVELAGGRNTIVLDVPLDEGRVHRFRAIYEPDTTTEESSRTVVAGDTLTQNNAAEGFTITPGAGWVLHLDGVNSGGGTTLSSTLREAGLKVDTFRPEEAPGDILTLQGYDLVILENVPADGLSSEKQRALVSLVRDLGSGLVMVGGPESFGAGGWRGSEIEPMLPVLLDLPDKVVVPEVAIMLVLDNSGSMNFHVMGSTRSQQQIANEAAALAIRSLDKRDLLGVITFNNGYSTLIPLGPNKDPAANADLVRGISAGGGTDALPAMEEGFRQLMAMEAKNRLMIVMSDGRSQNAELLPEAAARFAASGVRVSAISVGDRADLSTMAAIASRGNGESYEVINPNVLPKVFMRAVRVVRSPLVREQPFVPRVVTGGSSLLAGVPAIGELGGLSLTQARREPTVINALATEEGEPVLAHWQVELGQVAAFTSDAGRWAAEWIKTPSYRRFWTQVARSMSRVDMVGRGIESRAEAADGRLKLRLDSSGTAGVPRDGLDVAGTVYAPDGTSREVRLKQTGPGVYEADVAAGSSGTYIAILRPRDGDRRLSPVVVGASSAGGVEYRQLRSNATLLDLLASETGGRRLSFAELPETNFFDRGGVRPLEVLLPIWRQLLIWTLIILLLDIATRKVAWDRWVSREFGGGLAREASLAVVDRGARAAATLDALRSEKPGSASAYTPPVLGQQDAETLARAARERRRAQSAPDQPAPGVDAPTGKPAEPETGLLAAKRRAAERYRE